MTGRRPRRRGGATALGLLAAAMAGGCGAAPGDTPPATGAPDVESGTASRAATATPMSPVADLRWSTADCTLPDSPVAPIGRPARALIAAFGLPLTDTRFVLGTGLTPPRMVLLNRLPLKGNARVTVREMNWIRSGCGLTAWLTAHDGGADDDGWRVVQTLRASAAAEY